MSRVIAQFIFSSITELRFGHCKRFLKKLLDIENQTTEHPDLTSRSRYSQALSPIPGLQSTPKKSPHMRISSIGTSPYEKGPLGKNTPGSGNKKARKRVPNLSLVSVFPEIFLPPSSSEKNPKDVKVIGEGKAGNNHDDKSILM